MLTPIKSAVLYLSVGSIGLAFLVVIVAADLFCQATKRT